ncbi:MAG: hypothetical protein ABJC09_03625 [Terriglobia bacterium]
MTSGSEIVKSKYLVDFGPGNRLDHACLLFGNQGKVDYQSSRHPAPDRTFAAFDVLRHEKPDQTVQAGPFFFGHFFEPMGQSLW